MKIKETVSFKITLLPSKAQEVAFFFRTGTTVNHDVNTKENEKE